MFGQRALCPSPAVPYPLVCVLWFQSGKWLCTFGLCVKLLKQVSTFQSKHSVYELASDRVLTLYKNGSCNITRLFETFV